MYLLPLLVDTWKQWSCPRMLLCRGLISMSGAVKSIECMLDGLDNSDSCDRDVRILELMMDLKLRKNPRMSDSMSKIVCFFFLQALMVVRNHTHWATAISFHCLTMSALSVSVGLFCNMHLFQYRESPTSDTKPEYDCQWTCTLRALWKTLIHYFRSFQSTLEAMFSKQSHCPAPTRTGQKQYPLVSHWAMWKTLAVPHLGGQHPFLRHVVKRWGYPPHAKLSSFFSLEKSSLPLMKVVQGSNRLTA